MSMNLDDFARISSEVNRVSEEAFNTMPNVIVKDSSFRAKDIPSSSSNEWIKLDEVVCVLADLKSSTQLGLDKHDTTTARIYRSSVEGAVKIFREFGADFIDIQGDGGFGLFWGERAHERALCAAVTIRTFSENWENSLPERWKQSSSFPPTGYKVGIHSARTLVKKVGTIRVLDQQKPIWAGKAVNYAAKCAQAAERHQVVITQKVWEKFKKNDYIAFSCDCHDGPTSTLWEAMTVDRLPPDENDAFLLKNGWCERCGPELCVAIMNGQTKRDIPTPVRHALPKIQMSLAIALEKEMAKNQRRNRRGTW